MIAGVEVVWGFFKWGVLNDNVYSFDINHHLYYIGNQILIVESGDLYISCKYYI